MLESTEEIVETDDCTCESAEDVTADWLVSVELTPEIDESSVDSDADSAEFTDETPATVDATDEIDVLMIETELLSELTALVSELAADWPAEAMTETLVRRDCVDEEPTEIDELMVEKLSDTADDNELIAAEFEVVKLPIVEMSLASDETWLEIDEDSPAVICA